VNIPPGPEATLAHLFQQARALASGEPHLEQAFALYEAFAALPDSARLEKLHDRTRLAVIIALRRQALAARNAWAERRWQDSRGSQDTEAVQQALRLLEAALKLHSEYEAARSETEHLVRFLRTTLALAAASPKRKTQRRKAQTAQVEEPAVEVLPAAAPRVDSEPTRADPEPVERAEPEPAKPEPAEEVAAKFEIWAEPEPVQEAVPHSERDGSAAGTGRRFRRSQVIGMAALAAAAALFVVGLRIGKMGGSPTDTARPSPRPQPAAVAHRPPSISPQASRSTPSPQPSPQTVAMLLQSEPSGAQVLIDGTLQGTTPLRLERKPGSTIQVTIRRGSRVWRGTLRLEQKSDQEIMIRLPRPQPVAAQAPARPRPASTPAPAATVVNPQAHFAALMREGVQLYRSGWYGPAMGRFRQASAVMPASPRPYLWLGRAGIRAQRYREARGALERVIALAPASDAAREAQMLLNRLRNVPETTTSG